MKKFCFLLAAAALVAACQKPSNGGGPVDDNTLSYGGVTYKTVTLSNGQTWMAEPLRYVPEARRFPMTLLRLPESGIRMRFPQVLQRL